VSIWNSRPKCSIWLAQVTRRVLKEYETCVAVPWTPAADVPPVSDASMVAVNCCDAENLTDKSPPCTRL